MDTMKIRKKIIVVGGGFAGIEFVKNLDSAIFDIVLIDKINHHQFQPLFYQVATAQLGPSSISFPLRSIFKNKSNVQVRLAEVYSVQDDHNKIHTSIGDFTYDYLIIAIGCETNFFGNTALRKHSFTLKTTYNAIEIRNHILQVFEKIISADEKEKEGLLNLVIVGAGPTGVELAGAFAEIKQHILLKEYPGVDFSKFKVMLLEGTKHTLNNMSEDAKIASQKYLEQMGVTVFTETLVNDYDGETLTLKNGSTIHTKTVIWAAGVIGNSIQGFEANKITEGKRIKVNRTNKVIGTAEIYALGDIAYMETTKYPKGHPQVANVAIGQAKRLAKNFKRMQEGKQTIPYEYMDLGSMATIGRLKAVVDLPFIKIKGYIAWLIWMFLHLMLILGIKNKLIIFINWFWAFISTDTTLHLILTPTNASKETAKNKIKKGPINLEQLNIKSLSSMLTYLTATGFVSQFKVTEQGLMSIQTEKIFQPDEVEMAHYYRFEGASDPDDNEIVFAIVTQDGERGTLVDAYGMYNDSKITNFMKKIDLPTMR